MSVGMRPPRLMIVPGANTSLRGIRTPLNFNRRTKT